MTHLDKLPPQNLDAERGVLGSMLLDDSTIDEVAEVLRPEDFYRDVHQLVYSAIFAVRKRGGPVDSITVIEELERSGKFAEVGDETIRGLIDGTPHAANARYYAEIVADKAVRRLVRASSLETLREIESDLHTADELIEFSERRIFAIGQRRAGGRMLAIGPVSGRSMDSVLARKAGLDDDGVPSGLDSLDDMLGGFRPGQMIVLAARPSMGKTALAFNVAEHLAVGHGLGVLFISLEMGNAEIGDRFLVLRSGVPMNKVRQPEFADEEDIRKLGEAVAPDWVPLWLDDSSSLSPTQIAAISRRHKQKHGLRLLVVDYLQLVRPDDARMPRHEQVGAASCRMKWLAGELGIPVLVIAQLNRESEKRPDKRPLLSDLRESGQIEQDADVALLIHRPEYYKPGEKPGLAEVIVAKNRNGATGMIEVVFEKELMRFSDPATEYERHI